MSKPRNAAGLFGDSPVPRYAQLSSLLRRRIERGQWGAGERVPTLEALMSEFGVARGVLGPAVMDEMEGAEVVRRQEEEQAADEGHAVV